MRGRQVNRREFIGSVAAGASVAALRCSPAITQGIASVIVVGGGFAGATCARQLRRLDPKIQVTLVETNSAFTACPFSNAVIAGFRELNAQQFTYEKIAADGMTLAAARATAVEPRVRRVSLADGQTLSYDRLVLAPGIDMSWDALPGYSEAAAERMPHAWKAGEQTLLLRRQLETMEDGGLVVISVPANPFRCPPGPYERASLIAYYLKTHKPRSKLVILDAKDVFSKQRLFLNAWKELYPGMLEWVPLSKGGAVTEVDPATKIFTTDFGKHQASVGNVIPLQKAGRIAEIAGVASISTSTSTCAAPSINRRRRCRSKITTCWRLPYMSVASRAACRFAEASDERLRPSSAAGATCLRGGKAKLPSPRCGGGGMKSAPEQAANRPKRAPERPWSQRVAAPPKPCPVTLHLLLVRPKSRGPSANGTRRWSSRLPRRKY